MSTIHPKVLSCLLRVGLTSGELPKQREKWDALLKTLTQLTVESMERLEIAENTLSIAAQEMDRLYADLKAASESELEKTNKDLLLTVEENRRLLAFSESILEASTDGILVVDHIAGKILRQNKRFATMWRIPEDLLMENNFQVVLNALFDQMLYAEQFSELVKGLSHSPETESYDTLEFRDGRVFNCYSVPLHQGEATLGRVCFFRDVTEVLIREKQINEQRAQLINSTKMSSLGEMSSGIAHEINNPLGVIQGRAIQLIRGFKEGNIAPEKTSQYLEKIYSESERIAKIIKGLVAFARNGELDPFVPVNVIDLINDVLSLCSERFKNSNVELTIGTIPNVTFEGRATQLAQVLSNLLNNSFDAIIELQDKWVKVEVIQNDKVLQIIVTDSGKGIPQQVVEKMMNPFFTTKPIGKGTGLGLSISKGILEDHKGSLRYDSQCPNTRFIVELPVSQQIIKLNAA